MRPGEGQGKPGSGQAPAGSLSYEEGQRDCQRIGREVVTAPQPGQGPLALGLFWRWLISACAVQLRRACKVPACLAVVRKPDDGVPDCTSGAEPASSLLASPLLLSPAGKQAQCCVPAEQGYLARCSPAAGSLPASAGAFCLTAAVATLGWQDRLQGRQLCPGLCAGPRSAAAGALRH